MKTLIYVLQNETVALRLCSNLDTSVPVLEDFLQCLNEEKQINLHEEVIYFDLFDENNKQVNAVKHAVVNANNITVPDTFVFFSVRELIQTWDKHISYALFKSMQVLRWRQEHNFCSRCGSRTYQHHKELTMVCKACQYRQYPRIQPCVIVAITKKDDTHSQKQIFLAKHKRFTSDIYSVIAGFVEVGETLEQAVKREVFEETGLHVNNLVYLASQPWPYPTNLMIAFEAEYESGDIVLDTDELEKGGFYYPHELPHIPSKGTISYEMINHVCYGTQLNL